MVLGTLSSETRRDGSESMFGALRAMGLGAVQLSLAPLCGPGYPDCLAAADLKAIKDAADYNGVAIAALDGTFNMAHPDPAVRGEGVRMVRLLASACGPLGCPTITLCTGSKNAASMWEWHPDNASEGAWEDMAGTMGGLIGIAEASGIALGIEPEPSNVVSTPERARRLLDRFKSPALGIVMDAANLFQRGEAHPGNAARVLTGAFGLLGGDVILAHCKDIREGPGLEYTSPGNGVVDFGLFVRLLKEHGYRGPLILHGSKDVAELTASVAHVTGVTRLAR